MSLYDELRNAAPFLTDADFYHRTETVILQNDGDGDYIAKWDRKEPLPEGFSLGKL